MKDNLGIGIANAVWVGGIITIIILKDTSLWLLAVPICFNWSFIKPEPITHTSKED